MLTLVIATHNGGSTLPRCLESFTRLVPPEGGWKLIVVDNASTDDTREVVSAFETRLPLQQLHEPRAGKTIALNHAIAHFEGDVVIFTDDDIVADAGWLATMRNVADKNPQFAIFGGAIRALWPTDPPDWLLRAIPYRIVFGITGEDLVDGPVTPGRVWGGNMAVRREVFLEGHAFDESVGPRPGQYRMGSETEFTTRLARLGYRCWHCSEAKVHHIIRAEQMDPQWIVKRGYRFGRDMFWKENDPLLVSSETLWPAETKRFLGLPRWYFGAFLRNSVTKARAKMLSDFDGWLKASWEVEYWRGYLREAIGPGKHVRQPRTSV